MPPTSNSNTNTNYKTTRAPHLLLNAGTKQSLQKTKRPSKPHSLNPSVLPASVSFFPSRSTADGEQTESSSTARTQEADIVGIAGQQFLDPGVWEGMKRRRRDQEGDGDYGEGGTGKGGILGRKEAEEEERRRREREAEFGGMAVRGRIRGNV